MQTSGRCGPGKPWWNFSATSMNADHSEINIILLRAQYPCASFQIPLFLSCFTHLHILQNRKLHNLTSLRILQRQVTEQRSAANLCAAQHRPAASELQWNYWNQSMVLKKINKSKRVFLSSIQTDTISLFVLLSPECLGKMHYLMHPLQGGCSPTCPVPPKELSKANCYTTLKIQTKLLQELLQTYKL